MKKKSYKIMPIILAIMVMFSAIYIPSTQVMASTTGTTADGLKYTKYTVADDLVASDYVEITGYTGTPTVIVIPPDIDGIPVTKIGGQAFRECSSLTDVTIPEGVTIIDYEAFNRCNNLTNVTLPNSLTNISWGAFWGCSKLTNITIPMNVTTIGNGAFNSSGLTSVTISSNLTSIGVDILGSTPLTSATISYGVTSIVDNLFSGCYMLNDVIIPTSVTRIGNFSFSYCSNLTTITIPNSVTSIGDFAFYDCINLTNITIPNSVTSLSSYAFLGCSILNINAGSATLQDYESIGIVGVTNSNLINANAEVIIAKSAKGSNLTKTEIQTTVTEMNAISAINAGNATLEDYTSISILGVTNSNLINANAEVIIAKSAKGSNLTKTEIQTIVTEMNAISAINAGNATLQDYTALGITGVMVSNLNNANTAVVIAKTDKGSNLTKTEIQTAITDGLASVGISRTDDTLTAELLKVNGSEFTTSAAVTFEWYRDDNLIDGENGNTYLLSDIDKGTSINVEVPQYGLISEYIDIPGQAASIELTRNADILTAKLLNPNGSEFITGEAVTFEWYRDDNVIDGENNNTYLLSDIDKGTSIKVEVPQYGLISEYIDISGEAATIELTKDDDTLTAKILNPNGIEFIPGTPVIFEWYRDDTIIDGKNNNIYQLSDDDKGTSINVEAPQYGLVSEYIDIPDDPIDDVTTPSAVTVQIKGTEIVGNTLIAEILDENGHEFTTSAAVTYEWSRLSSKDSVSGSTVGNTNTYTLVSSDKDNYIKLVVYADDEELGTDTTGKIVIASSGSSSHHHHRSSNSNSANAGIGNLSESQANTVNNIISILGDGTAIGKIKVLVTIEGAKVTIININKDSERIGFVFTSETSNTITTIPNDGTVKAVYKYVPLLGKYILVSDAVITENSITLPMQANATYLASSVVLSSTDTITPGWLQVDNKWYMVSAAGDLLTGWINDGNGWTYLSPTDGVMQTGWVNNGSKWYYMKDNGYMATGWVETNGRWYYLNEDGSMAVNTTINGYIIDSTGAWIS